MPDQHIDNLLDSVQEHLPNHVDEILRAAFNYAEHEYRKEKTALGVA